MGLGLLLPVVLMTKPGSLVTMKVLGFSPYCPWARVLSYPEDAASFERSIEQYLAVTSVRGSDGDIQLVQSPDRPFWVKARGELMGGQQLISYLLAEHDWMAEKNPDRMVRPGDIVLDCGAHVGTFVHDALRRGARKVIAIEPDPGNLECLRRNFRDEVATEKVIIIPMGVWISTTTLSLDLGVQNSGANTFVRQEGGGFIEVPVTTIDGLVEQLSLDKVDYIKMDIEGAERHALSGGLKTLKRFKPRLLLESYHLPDDMEVLPKILRQARPDVQFECGPCEGGEDINRLVPHVTYWW